MNFVLESQSLKFSIQDMINSQQGVIGEIIKAKTAKGGGKNSYSGFPVKFFEDKSYLERISEWFTLVPYYLPVS